MPYPRRCQWVIYVKFTSQCLSTKCKELNSWVICLFFLLMAKLCWKSSSRFFEVTLILEAFKILFTLTEKCPHAQVVGGTFPIESRPNVQVLYGASACVERFTRSQNMPIMLMVHEVDGAHIEMALVWELYCVVFGNITVKYIIHGIFVHPQKWM